MAFEAKVIEDSVSQMGDRLTTMMVTFPRIILAEFNTHRVFSRNSASSRAIPVKKQLERVSSDPFVPTNWGANKPGMQAGDVLSSDEQVNCERLWMMALQQAVASAEQMMQIGAHKQHASRLLEPFMWHTVIVTATEWSNFFALRDNPMAQPEIATIARMMRKVYNESQPRLVSQGEWHLPLIQPEERDPVFVQTHLARKVSAARCARVSYLTHDGRRDLMADLELFDRLADAGHMSPFEHVATPANHAESQFIGNFRGWKQLRKFMPGESDYSLVQPPQGA